MTNLLISTHLQFPYSMQTHYLQAPLTTEDLLPLHAGDEVRINGTVYVARDAAHMRMAALLTEGKPLPFDPVGQMIYYMGPTPPKPGQVIGSAGPTTAGRVDRFTPRLAAKPDFLSRGIFSLLAGIT